MENMEFKDFDHKPEIRYLVTGEQPFHSDHYWSEDVKVKSYDEAVLKAKIFSKKYHNVFITKEFMYIYQMM
jgi:hypothetical protein